MASPVTVAKSGPGLAHIAEDLKRLQASDVLVGIPAPKAQRRGQPVNNAELLFIHSHGSQLRNIPARPVLEPAIEASVKVITPHLAEAAKNVMDQRPAQAEVNLQRAGTAASNAARRWFVDPRNGWAPNAPSTIKRKGSDKPLIDTASMRRAITFVVRVNP
jgi:hypothetical protein